MIIYSIGKRIKDFLRVRIFSKSSKTTVVHNRNTIGDEPVDSGLRTEIWHYDNGKIKAELTYNKKKLEGISTFYYESGRIKAKENYKEGKLDGLTKRYYEIGSVESEEYYRNGTMLFRRLFSLKGTLTKEEIS
ncbi:MAG: hypothetical protein V1720_16685 [bacterium]